MKIHESLSFPSHRLNVISYNKNYFDNKKLIGWYETVSNRVFNAVEKQQFPQKKITCHIFNRDNPEQLNIQMMFVAGAMVLQIECTGGVLIHGALAEINGKGVILAGPGGAGKSTASKRLPPTWRSHCDDATLVVMDSEGTYRAHPWPTWSRFWCGEEGGCWNVEYSVPIKGIFYISRSEFDYVEQIEKWKTSTLLMAAAEQVNAVSQRGLSNDEIRKIRLQRFNNICNISTVVPGYLLKMGKDGDFWRKIEEILV